MEPHAIDSEIFPGHRVCERDGLRWIEPVAPLGGVAPIRFTTRHGGGSRAPYTGLNLAFHVGDVPERVRLNRRALARTLPPRLLEPVAMDQVHGTRLAFVGELHAGTRWEALEPALAETDALATATRRLPLTVLVADCVAVAIVDPRRGALAVAHAGWRGLAGGILPGLFERVAATYGTDPADCHAWISPAIGPCCYRVGAEVAAQLAAAPAEFAPGGEADGHSVDLWSIAAGQLGAAGVPSERITIVRLCTSCRDDLFFSHRRATRAGDPATGRQALVAWLEPPSAP